MLVNSTKCTELPHTCSIICFIALWLRLKDSSLVWDFQITHFGYLSYRTVSNTCRCNIPYFMCMRASRSTLFGQFSSSPLKSEPRKNSTSSTITATIQKQIPGESRQISSLKMRSCSQCAFHVGSSKLFASQKPWSRSILDPVNYRCQR